MTTIDTSNIEKAKQLIKQEKNKEKPIIVIAKDDNFNKKMLEYGKFDILLGIEYDRKDSKRQLDSGLNSFLASLASKNKVSLGIDVNELNKLEKKQKSVILARIIQNIKLCRKAKAKISIINYNDKLSAFSLLLSLGADTKQAQESFN
jgi:RNase P/RNase MRP subunit p30